MIAAHLITATQIGGSVHILVGWLVRWFFACLCAYSSGKECPNNWVADPWDCLVFQVEGDNGVPFVGTWELATDWGVSRFQPASKSGAPWVLTEASIEWED